VDGDTIRQLLMADNRRRGVARMEWTVEQESAAFEKLLSEHLVSHAGEYALQKCGQIKGFYPTYAAAYATGTSSFGLDAVFLVAKVEKSKPEVASYAWYAGVSFG